MGNADGKIQELDPEQMGQVSGGKDDTENREYTCSECGAVFGDFRQITLHAIKEHPYSKKPQR